MADTSRGRPVSVSVEDMHRHLVSTDEPCTVSDFASEFDVSNETVRKRVGELENVPGVASKKVGKAKVFWESTDQYIEDRPLDVEEIEEVGETRDLEEEIREYQEKANEDLLLARAKWLDRRESYITHRFEPQNQGQDIVRRSKIWSAFQEYRREAKKHLPLAYFESAVDETVSEKSEQEEPVQPDTKYDDEHWLLDTETFEYYVYEIPLFGSEIEGFAECDATMLAIEKEYKEEHEKIADEDEEVDLDRLDELLPPFEETLHAADAFDDFLCGLVGFNW